jgi:hypothetical protein
VYDVQWTNFRELRAGLQDENFNAKPDIYVPVLYVVTFRDVKYAMGSGYYAFNFNISLIPDERG